jgi:thioredoxin 1
MSSNVTSVTLDSFDETISSAQTPVLVDFWAEWCGPCKMIAPVLDEISQENGDKIKIVKVNVDENAELARRFEVMSIPTLIVFKDGEVAKRLVGAKNKNGLLDDLSDFL